MKRMIIGLLYAILATNAFAYYNPSQGRWLSRDPVDEPGATLLRRGTSALPASAKRGAEALMLPQGNELNPYVFVLNDPVLRTDWLALFANFIDCNCCQIEALKKDEAVAQAHIASLKQKIQAVLPDILANPDKYPFRTGYKFNTALARLDKASAKLKSATVVCSIGSSAIASADWYGKKMWVYEPYWQYTDFAQGAHLVHEGMHMGAGATDAAYFWQNRRAPRDTFFVLWNSIASTYDSWIIDGFCIPGYDCPTGILPPIPHIYCSGKECP